MGDPSIAELNTTILDGRAASMDDLVMASSAMPFLAERRLVIVNHATAFGENDQARGKFIAFLEGIPQTTALVLVADHPLTSYQMEKRGELHWLEKWGRGEEGRAYIKKFVTPTGSQLVDWIARRAVELGGEISSPAANLLAKLAGDDLRSVDHEIEKLLAFVNYVHRIEVEDVEALTVGDRQDSIFDLVDAIGNRIRSSAIDHFHALLLEQDAMSVQMMIVRQFRLLLLGREILEKGGDAREIARRLEVKPFVANKVAVQARKFPQPELEEIYHRLLEIDVAVKTGIMDVDLNVDLLIEAVTRIPAK
jgi:DNA polymerase-3 subunit delta